MSGEEVKEEALKDDSIRADDGPDKEPCESSDEIEKLKCELEQKNKEIATLKDTMIRRQADFENYKKIMLKKEDQTKKQALINMASHIIKINDDLIRAAESVNSLAEDSSVEDVRKSFLEGVSIISRGIVSILDNSSITEIESENTPFDPNLHEAVEIDMAEGLSCDTVTKVYQKGYRLEDFVIRTAKVKVSKPLPA